MFAQLKEKISDTLWSLSSDDADKHLNDLVTRGTAETLIAPEWSINLALVDMVNQNPAVMAEKLLKVLKRAVLRPNAKTQILTLTILETCIKNCVPALYDALAHSELWLELVKIAADTSITQVDADVRDKVLCMIEDYAKVLPQQEFREAYEYLLEHNVDFPVRSPDDQAPILTPPSAYQPPAVVAPGAAPPASPAAAAATAALVGHGHRQGQGVAGAGAGQDPFVGMSQEDRAAVQAAMAEMEEEERAERESAAMAASNALFEQMGQQQQGEGAAGQQEQQQRPAPGVQQRGTNAPPSRDVGPALPENTEEALQTIGNATGLLNEMLASETDPREPFVVELAEQCIRFRSKLEDIINTLTDEVQLGSALTHHEALQAAVTKYDEHLSRAEQGAPLVTPAAGLNSRPLPQQGETDDLLGAFTNAATASGAAVTAAAAAAAAQVGAHVGGYAQPPAAPGGHSAGPNFTLLGEDEEEDRQEESFLNSKRGAAVPDTTLAPAPTPVSSLVATPPAAAALLAGAAGTAGTAGAAGAAPAGGANLLDLLDDLTPAPATHAAPVAAVSSPAAVHGEAGAHAPASEQLRDVDSLLEGLTVGDLAPPAHAAAPGPDAPLLH